LAFVGKTHGASPPAAKMLFTTLRVVVTLTVPSDRAWNAQVDSSSKFAGLKSTPGDTAQIGTPAANRSP
jgi:hypothetical protein